MVPAQDVRYATRNHWIRSAVEYRKVKKLCAVQRRRFSVGAISTRRQVAPAGSSRSGRGGNQSDASIGSKTIASLGRDLAGGNAAIIAFGRRVLFLPSGLPLLSSQFQAASLAGSQLADTTQRGTVVARRGDLHWVGRWIASAILACRVTTNVSLPGWLVASGLRVMVKRPDSPWIQRFFVYVV
jgi:hypothetical protein